MFNKILIMIVCNWKKINIKNIASIKNLKLYLNLITNIIIFNNKNTLI
jgi:hypothetical protein